MKLFEINRNPSAKQLRQFGLALALVVLMLGWLLKFDAVGFTISIAMASAALAMVRPQSLKGLFVGMTLAAAPLGMVVGELATLLLFYGVFLPIGMMFRLIGRDSLHRCIDRNASTYWHTARKAGEASHYFRRY